MKVLGNDFPFHIKQHGFLVQQSLSLTYMYHWLFQKKEITSSRWLYTEENFFNQYLVVTILKNSSEEGWWDASQGKGQGQKHSLLFMYMISRICIPDMTTEPPMMAEMNLPSRLNARVHVDRYTNRLP